MMAKKYLYRLLEATLFIAALYMVAMLLLNS